MPHIRVLPHPELCPLGDEIAVFTAAFGRLWCGWTCPQTVFMEMVFRPIEYLIEGDAPAQRALNRAPWTAGKLARKLAKHGLFLALSFVIGNTLLAYLVGAGYDHVDSDRIKLLDRVEGVRGVSKRLLAS